MFDVPYPPALFATLLSLAAGVWIAVRWPRFAGTTGLVVGALLLALVEAGRANALLIPAAQVLAADWDSNMVVAESCFCGLAAVITRGFLSGSIQAWWRLL